MKNTYSETFRRIFILIIVVLTGQVYLYAQGGFSLSPNLILNYQSLPPSDLKEHLEGTPAGSDIPSLEFKTFNFKASYPLVLSILEMNGQKIPTKMLFNSIAYQNSQNKFRDLPYESKHLNTENFESIGYMGVYIQMLSMKWTLFSMLGTTLAVDEFVDAEISDLTYQGALGLDRRLDSGWTIGLGVVVAQVTGQTEILPLLHINKESEKMSFEFLGLEGSYWYKINKNMRLGLLFEVSGSQYNFASINNNKNKTNPFHDKNGNIINDDVDIALAHSQVTAGPAMVISLSKHFNTELKGGIVTGRRFEFFKLGDDKTLRWGEGDGPSVPAEAYGKKQDFHLKTGIFG
ncbi:MAG: DUF6268 family outer membrane beta-barrel protein, partial [Candidatus Odinarchaeota archaeon]